MKRRYIILTIAISLILWITIDLNYPFRTDISKFNSIETARLDAAMWRSYYERKPFKLFLQSAELMRSQFHVPFWRSNLIAFHAAKAAFIFKDGKNRLEYEKALPHLLKYFNEINQISKQSFDPGKAATLELEWWIVRRYRNENPPPTWEKLLADGAAIVYHVPAEKFNDYAQLRVTAMLLRDSKGNSITEGDWQHINSLLQNSWQSFETALQ